MKPLINFFNDTHHDRNVVTLKFDYDPEPISQVRVIHGSKWSNNKKYWYIEQPFFKLRHIKEIFSPVTL